MAGSELKLGEYGVTKGLSSNAGAIGYKKDGVVMHCSLNSCLPESVASYFASIAVHPPNDPLKLSRYEFNHKCPLFSSPTKYNSNNGMNARVCLPQRSSLATLFQLVKHPY